MAKPVLEALNVAATAVLVATVASQPSVLAALTATRLAPVQETPVPRPTIGQIMTVSASRRPALTVHSIPFVAAGAVLVPAAANRP